MSRIGKLPITVPQGTTIAVDAWMTIAVTGPKGQLLKQFAMPEHWRQARW
jgi:ribosomal protein L6P/L9E